MDDLMFEIIPNFDGSMPVTKVGLKRRFYEGLEIIDSQLHVKPVRGIRNVRSSPNAPILSRLVGNPLMLVDLEFSDPGYELSLEELQERINAFLVPGSIWEEAWGDLDAIRAKVSGSGSFEELVSQFGKS